MGERIITSPHSSCITADDISLASQDVLNFCANNYLGLSNHPSLLNAAKEALTKHGFGLSSVRFICGTQDKHKELEAAISKFHGTEDTIRCKCRCIRSVIGQPRCSDIRCLESRITHRWDSFMQGPSLSLCTWRYGGA